VADPDRTAAVPTTGRAGLMLALATAGFALNFWACALLSPLGTHFKLSLHLTDFRQALLLAVPVIVGSLGRIPVGALTDRYGGVPEPLIARRTDRTALCRLLSWASLHRSASCDLGP
jgi:Nitrate/nitrite transporter